MQADPGETTDLAPTRPENLNEMRAALEKMHADVQADEPVWPSYVNSHYEDVRIEWPAYAARPLTGEKLEPKPERLPLP